MTGEGDLCSCSSSGLAVANLSLSFSSIWISISFRRFRVSLSVLLLEGSISGTKSYNKWTIFITEIGINFINLQWFSVSCVDVVTQLDTGLHHRVFSSSNGPEIKVP